MDLNDYTLMLLLQDRHTEMVVAARRDALLREATRPRRAFRTTLSTVLIRLDAWLQVFWTVRSANAIARCHGDSSSTLTQEGETNYERRSSSSHRRRAPDPAARE